MWSSYIMDLLLLLQCYGCEYAVGSQAAQFDYNSDGIIGMYDLLQHLSLQPPILKN